MKEIFVRETVNNMIFIFAANQHETYTTANMIDEFEGINVVEARYNCELKQATIICTTRKSTFQLNSLLKKLDFEKIN